MEKAWFHEKLFSEVVMVMVKDKKIHHKRCNFNQNKFYALHEVDKRNVTNGFQRIGSGLYFFAPFSFLLSLSNKIVIFSKNLGGCRPPPVSMGLWNIFPSQDIQILKKILKRKVRLV